MTQISVINVTCELKQAT